MENSNVLQMPERLSDSDFDYFSAAMDQYLRAKSILDFVQVQLVKHYGLADNDQIRADGTIVRAQNQ